MIPQVQENFLLLPESHDTENSAKENDPLRMRTFKKQQKKEASRQSAPMKLLREITTPNTKNKIKKITQCLREDVDSLHETKEIGSNPTSP